jgi:uncharacterized protein (TIGR03435 family)
MGLLAQDIYAYGSRLGELDKPVVDQTGLQGRFDFIMELPAGIGRDNFSDSEATRSE